MNKLCLRVCAAVLAAALLCSAAGCKNNEKTESINTYDTASKVQQTVSVPIDTDEGKHKDYDTQTAEAYYSYGILVADQDGNKRAMELFVGEEDTAQFYSNELNTMKERLGNKVNVYSMVVPTACEYYCPSNYRKDIDSQKNIIDTIGESLINVQNINVWETLSNHNAENIYFRSDTRWTPLGAYYAGRIFAKELKSDYPDISEYKKKLDKEYIGNMQQFLDYESVDALKITPDIFTYYEPSVQYKTYYYDENFEFLTEGEFFEEVEDSLYESYFKGGFYSLKITTDAGNGRKLIVVKENATNALIPYLFGLFEEIYVVDIDYTEANLVEMIEDFKITDLLYAVTTATATSTRAYQLETLRSQATHGRLEDNATDTEEDTDNNNTEKDTENEEGEDNTPQYEYDVGLNNVVSEYVPEENDDYEQYDEGEYYEQYDYDEGEYY